MQSLKAKRIGKFSEAKLSILQLLEQLECEPDNSFERTIVCEDEESFVLSAANLDAVEVSQLLVLYDPSPTTSFIIYFFGRGCRLIWRD